MHHTTVLASLKVGRSIRTSVPPFVGMFVTPPALFQGFPPVRLRGQTLQSFEKNFRHDINPISVVPTLFFFSFHSGAVCAIFALPKHFSQCAYDGATFLQ